MNVLSLFAGIGGLDLGLERAGMTIVGQVELDPFCRKVLAKHWPEVPRHDDVRTCVDWWLGTNRPAVDLVCGGFPCQGHSVAGRQRGTADERWGWPWYREVVNAIRPPWVLIENVPNLVRTGLLDVLRDLADLGFDAWWGRIPAAAVGAPHLRWRLFVIAAHPGRVQLRNQPGWECGPDRGGPTVIGHDGAAWALANTDGYRLARTWVSAPAGRHNGADPRRRGETLALTSCAGPSAPEPAAVFAARRRDEGRAATERSWWAAEPDVGRVAHGVPARVDRLRALGNAVVPQVAEHIGRLILTAARALGRVGITVDRSADYCRLAAWRTRDRGQLAKVLGVPKPPAQVDGQADLLDELGVTA